MTPPATTSTVPSAHTDAAMPVRRVRFDWSDTPLHWVPADPQTTHTFNVLHLLLPAGERWFVHVFRQALPDISDPVLRAQVKAFMGQESVHSRAHAQVLEHLAAQGIDTRPFTDRVEWLFGQLLGDDVVGRTVPRFARGWWLRERIAVVAAIEHYTSIMGDWILNSPALDAAGTDPVMLDLLRWHGAEEVEHRSVAFDLARTTRNGAVRRFRTMAITSLAITYLWWVGTRYFMAADPTKPPKASWRGLLRAGRKGRLPTLRQLFGTVPHYVLPSYHPSNYGSTVQAEQYLASSPGVLATSGAG